MWRNPLELEIQRMARRDGSWSPLGENAEEDALFVII
jgi:hypothetical protein